MSTSTHNSRSPPRRARSPSGIPAPYLSANFSAATHALQLIGDPHTDVQTTLSSLRTLRDNISASLHSTAPSWGVLTPALASLQDALHTTQTSSQLRQKLTAMHHDISALDDYPTRMASVVHRASQLSANVALSSAVREFAHLLRAAEVPEPFVLPLHQSAHEPSPYSSVPSPEYDAAKVPVLPERFLQRAAALRRARAVASSAPLVHITALNDARSTLSRYHNSLQEELETALVAAIFAPMEPSAPSSQSDDVERARAFAQATTLETYPVNTSQLPQSIFPSLIQAVDLLGGRNHAASVLRDAAPAKLLSLVCEALLTDPARPPSTIASSPMSAYMTALPFSSTANPNNSQFPSSLDTSGRLAYIFDEHLSPSNRLFCAVVFERVRSSMTNVLRRLSTLAEVADSEDSRIFEVLNHVWRSMEAALTSFLQALLAFPTLKPPSLVNDRDERQSNRISLLPERSRKASFLNADVPTVWELDRSQTSPDSFKAFMQNVKPLVPSIYNLEVIYSQLQQFITMSSRLKQSWRERVGSHLHDSARISPALSQLLARAVDLFVCTVRRDVREQMDTILGNRSGSLLQPLSRRDDSPKPSPGKTTQAKDTGRENDTGLSLLRQTQMLLNVIASCLTLTVAIPSIAMKIGEIINHEVLLPFCQRASHALELVAGWSDGGVLYNEMWNKIVQRESAIHADGSESSEDLTLHLSALHFSEQVRNTKIVSSRIGVSRGRVLHAIRNESGLSTKILGQLCQQNRRRIHQTRTLLRNEWDAVLRLVANVKLVISELEGCTVKRGDKTSGGVNLVTGEMVGRDDGSNLTGLKDLLQMRGAGSNTYGPIVEAIERTQVGRGMLREEVVSRGLILLHCEVVLHCFCSVVKALCVEDVANDNPERSLTRLHEVSPTYGDDERGSDDGCIVNTSESKAASGDTVDRIAMGNGLSRPSSIFKALPIQLSDVERTSDEESWGMNEFDEFGDRITVANENVNDTDIEEYMFPNSLLLEQNDWKAGGGEAEKGVKDSGALRTKSEETVTRSDRRAIEAGNAFGDELKRMDKHVQQNLGPRDRDYVVREADEAVGLGIRLSGEMRAKGDRDVATGARLLMDAAATAAADTLGWPVVESDYSVAEGASHSASECRTLLFAAGML